MKPSQQKRSRSYEGRRKTENSFIKLRMAYKVVWGQVSAFQHRFGSQPRMIFIDGNAGDGEGVAMPQGDLFDGAEMAQPTPRMLLDLAQRFNADVCLCDHDPDCRVALMQSFPGVPVLDHHSRISGQLHDHNYALWLSDPCGPGGHGIEYMRAISRRILHSDFVIVLNQLSLNRFVGVKHAPRWQTHQKYLPMSDPEWWRQKLAKKYFARTPVYKPSSGFHFRLLVVSNGLSDPVRRLPQIEIYP